MRIKKNPALGKSEFSGIRESLFRGQGGRATIVPTGRRTTKESPCRASPAISGTSPHTGREIGQELFTRTICGESILFWRTRAGTVTAMSDRCVHRRFPLSQPPSRLVEDQVVCGYHGFTYGADGGCVAVPGQTRVPRTARLKSYPVVELDSFVWVWIGDPALADAARIPRAPWLDSPAYTTVSGMEPLQARFGLLVDNLMDLSHETYLHGGYIGTPEVAATPITTTVDEEAGIVHVSRHMDDAECPPFYAKSTG